MVGRLDDPFVLVRAYLRHVDVVVVQKRGQRHRLFHEGHLVGVQKRRGRRVEQHLEYLLVVRKVPGEAADERHFLGPHGVDELLGLVPVVDHVVRDAAAPHRVDALPLAVAQHLAVEGELPHVGDGARHAAALEQLREHAELVDDGVLQEVDDGHARGGHPVLVGPVDAQERVHPRLEQLAARHLMRPANSRNVAEPAMDAVISRFSFMPDEPSALNSQNLHRKSSSSRNVSTRANGSTES